MLFGGVQIYYVNLPAQEKMFVKFTQLLIGG